MRLDVAEQLEPGARIDAWVVEAWLGGGGNGDVYRVRHGKNGRLAALKLLTAELAGSRDAAARFAREARVMQRLRHRGIARIYGAGVRDDGRPWLAMELLCGQVLSRLLLDRGALPPEEALELLEPVAAALAAAHRHGVIHRDVKAENVFVCEGEDGPRVVLLDFGVAKLLAPGEASLSVSGMAIGTPTCMAPEQSAGGTVDARTDVYALGVLAFQLLTGELPFADASPVLMRQLHRWARRPRPSSRVRLPVELDEVVMRAMARAPGERFVSPPELVAAFRAAMSSSGGARAEAAEGTNPGCVPVLALHVEAQDAGGDEDGAGGAGGDPLPQVVACLIQRGFQPALELGNSALLVRPSGGAEPSLDERRAALESARACQALVAPGGPRLRLYLDVRQAELVEGRVVGGPVMRLGEWLPDDPDAERGEVAGSASALEGLNEGESR